MKNPYTLVVIDMQPRFTAAQNKKVLKGVRREVITAKRLRRPIVLVEFWYNDELKSGKRNESDVHTCTHKDIAKLVEGYPKLVTILKDKPDGGKKVIKAINKKKYPKSRLKFCGVQTSVCVYETVKTVGKMLPKARIEVIKDACNDLPHEDPFSYYQYVKQAVLV